MKGSSVSFVALIAILLLCFCGAGCGGGGGGSDATPVTARRVSVTFNWAERSRNVAAPASALSAVIRLPGAKPGGGDVSWVADRGDDPAAHSQTYESGEDALTGSRAIAVTFFAGAGGTGAVVATATATVRISGDGVVQTAITNVQRQVAKVAVTPGQSLKVGEEKFLAFEARAANGQVVAVSPGSARFAAATGSDKLLVTGIVGKGVLAGAATIVATVDGIASPPAEVTVLPAVAVALVASASDPQAIALQQLLLAKNIVPTRFDAMPSPSALQGFDVLVLDKSGDLGKGDAPKVEAFLTSGKGVTLLGKVPVILANGPNVPDDGEADTTDIASWFGGIRAMVFTATGYAPTARAGAGLFALPPGLSPGDQFYTNREEGWFVQERAVGNPTVDRVAQVQEFDREVYALAYELPAAKGSGRVYWQWGYGKDAAYTERVVSLLVAGANWAARR